MTQVSRQQEYTVFVTHGFLDAANCKHLPLLEAIESLASSEPIAWALESTNIYTGTKNWEILLDESIAAGRLIELVDGKFIARGVPVEEAPKRVETLSFSFEWTEEEKPIAGPDATLEQVMDAVADMHIADAAMIARDCTKEAAAAWRENQQAKAEYIAAEDAKRNAPKLYPFHPQSAFRSPDQCNGPADHLNASRHQMAGMSKS